MKHKHDTRYYLRSEVDEQFYDKEEVDNLISNLFFTLVDEGVILMEHHHDDRYYTKQQTHEIVNDGQTGGTGGAMTGGTGGVASLSEYYTISELEQSFYTRSQLDDMFSSLSDTIDQRFNDLTLLVNNSDISSVEESTILVSNTDNVMVMADSELPAGTYTMDIEFSAVLEEVSGTMLCVSVYDRTTLVCDWQCVEVSSNDVGSTISLSSTLNITATQALRLLAMAHTTPDEHVVRISQRTLSVKLRSAVNVDDYVDSGFVECTGDSGSTGGYYGFNFKYSPIVFRCLNDVCIQPSWKSDLQCVALQDGSQELYLGAICPACGSSQDRIALIIANSYCYYDPAITCVSCQHVNTSLTYEEVMDYYFNSPENLKCPECGSSFLNIYLPFRIDLMLPVTGMVSSPSSTWEIPFYDENHKCYTVYSCYDSTSFFPTSVNFDISRRTTTLTFDEPKVGQYTLLTAARYSDQEKSTVWTVKVANPSNYVVFMCLDDDGNVLTPISTVRVGLRDWELTFEEAVSGIPYYSYDPEKDNPDIESYYGVDFNSKMEYTSELNVGGTGGSGGAVWSFTTPEETFNAIATRDFYTGSRTEPNTQTISDDISDMILHCAVTGSTGGTGILAYDISDQTYYDDNGEYTSSIGTIPFTGGIGGTGGTMNYDYSSGIDFYKTEITTVSSSWDIEHSLNSTNIFPICYDTNGNQIFPTSITLHSLNVATISFVGEYSGTVLCFTNLDAYLY